MTKMAKTTKQTRFIHTQCTRKGLMDHLNLPHHTYTHTYTQYLHMHIHTQHTHTYTHPHTHTTHTHTHTTPPTHTRHPVFCFQTKNDNNGPSAKKVRLSTSTAPIHVPSTDVQVSHFHQRHGISHEYTCIHACTIHAYAEFCSNTTLSWRRS